MAAEIAKLTGVSTEREDGQVRARIVVADSLAIDG